MNAKIAAYNKIQYDVNVMSASPHGLILMLFDKAISNLIQAKYALKQNDLSKKGLLIGKTISIINDGLYASLDKTIQNELVYNLNDLYLYSIQLLSEANLENDEKKIDAIIYILSELQDGWKHM